jgi:hypothetical protein
MAVALAWAATFTACGGSTCPELQNTAFQSVDEQVCDDTVMPPTMCSWTVAFRNGRYTWTRGSLQEEGDFNCDGATVNATTSAGASHSASYDGASGVLTWDGVAYQRQ